MNPCPPQQDEQLLHFDNEKSESEVVSHSTLETFVPGPSNSLVPPTTSKVENVKVHFNPQHCHAEAKSHGPLPIASKSSHETSHPHQIVSTSGYGNFSPATFNAEICEPPPIPVPQPMMPLSYLTSSSICGPEFFRFKSMLDDCENLMRRYEHEKALMLSESATEEILRKYKPRQEIKSDDLALIAKAYFLSGCSNDRMCTKGADNDKSLTYYNEVGYLLSAILRIV